MAPLTGPDSKIRNTDHSHNFSFEKNYTPNNPQAPICEEPPLMSIDPRDLATLVSPTENGLAHNPVVRLLRNDSDYYKALGGHPLLLTAGVSPLSIPDLIQVINNLNGTEGFQELVIQSSQAANWAALPSRLKALEQLADQKNLPVQFEEGKPIRRLLIAIEEIATGPDLSTEVARNIAARDLAENIRDLSKGLEQVELKISVYEPPVSATVAAQPVEQTPKVIIAADPAAPEVLVEPEISDPGRSLQTLVAGAKDPLAPVAGETPKVSRSPSPTMPGVSIQVDSTLTQEGHAGDTLLVGPRAEAIAPKPSRSAWLNPINWWNRLAAGWSNRSNWGWVVSLREGWRSRYPNPTRVQTFEEGLQNVIKTYSLSEPVPLREGATIADEIGGAKGIVTDEGVGKTRFVAERLLEMVQQNRKGVAYFLNNLPEDQFADLTRPVRCSAPDLLIELVETLTPKFPLNLGAPVERIASAKTAPKSSWIGNPWNFLFPSYDRLNRMANHLQRGYVTRFRTIEAVPLEEPTLAALIERRKTASNGQIKHIAQRFIELAKQHPGRVARFLNGIPPEQFGSYFKHDNIEDLLVLLEAKFGQKFPLNLGRPAPEPAAPQAVTPEPATVKVSVQQPPPPPQPLQIKVVQPLSGPMVSTVSAQEVLGILQNLRGNSALTPEDLTKLEEIIKILTKMGDAPLSTSDLNFWPVLKKVSEGHTNYRIIGELHGMVVPVPATTSPLALALADVGDLKLLGVSVHDTQAVIDAVHAHDIDARNVSRIIVEAKISETNPREIMAQIRALPKPDEDIIRMWIVAEDEFAATRSQKAPTTTAAKPIMSVPKEAAAPVAVPQPTPVPPPSFGSMRVAAGSLGKLVANLSVGSRDVRIFIRDFNTWEILFAKLESLGDSHILQLTREEEKLYSILQAANQPSGGGITKKIKIEKLGALIESLAARLPEPQISLAPPEGIIIPAGMNQVTEAEKGTSMSVMTKGPKPTPSDGVPRPVSDLHDFPPVQEPQAPTKLESLGAVGAVEEPTPLPVPQPPPPSIDDLPEAPTGPFKVTVVKDPQAPLGTSVVISASGRPSIDDLPEAPPPAQAATEPPGSVPRRINIGIPEPMIVGVPRALPADLKMAAKYLFHLFDTLTDSDAIYGEVQAELRAFTDILDQKYDFFAKVHTAGDSLIQLAPEEAELYSILQQAAVRGEQGITPIITEAEKLRFAEITARFTPLEILLSSTKQLSPQQADTIRKLVKSEEVDADFAVRLLGESKAHSGRTGQDLMTRIGSHQCQRLGLLRIVSLELVQKKIPYNQLEALANLLKNNPTLSADDLAGIGMTIVNGLDRQTPFDAILSIIDKNITALKGVKEVAAALLVEGGEAVSADTLARMLAEMNASEGFRKYLHGEYPGKFDELFVFLSKLKGSNISLKEYPEIASILDDLQFHYRNEMVERISVNSDALNRAIDNLHQAVSRAVAGEIAAEGVAVDTAAKGVTPQEPTTESPVETPKVEKAKTGWTFPSWSEAKKSAQDLLSRLSSKIPSKSEFAAFFSRYPQTPPAPPPSVPDAPVPPAVLPVEPPKAPPIPKGAPVAGWVNIGSGILTGIGVFFNVVQLVQVAVGPRKAGVQDVAIPTSGIIVGGATLLGMFVVGGPLGVILLIGGTLLSPAVGYWAEAHRENGIVDDLYEAMLKNDTATLNNYVDADPWYLGYTVDDEVGTKFLAKLMENGKADELKKPQFKYFLDKTIARLLDYNVGHDDLATALVFAYYSDDPNNIKRVFDVHHSWWGIRRTGEEKDILEYNNLAAQLRLPDFNKMEQIPAKLEEAIALYEQAKIAQTKAAELQELKETKRAQEEIKKAHSLYLNSATKLADLRDKFGWTDNLHLGRTTYFLAATLQMIEGTLAREKVIQLNQSALSYFRQELARNDEKTKSSAERGIKVATEALKKLGVDIR